MRIAFVVHDYHRWGGHSRYVAELATRFSEDHEVHVFANRMELSGDDRVIFHKVPALRTNVVTTLLSFAVTSPFAVRGNFDVVHSQGFCGPRSNVITTHICNEAWRQALSRFAGQSIRERIFHLLASKLEKHLYGGGDYFQVIAISKRVERDIVQFYGCRAKTHLIYHGVDLETFSPKVRRFRSERRQQLGLTDAGQVFLYVGDLRKGARQSIEALTRVPNAHLILVSRSDPAPYQALSRERGVAERVHLLAPTSHVEELYGAADALLLPTPYDAFAMVVTEAMACGLPVVVSREAGASELIEPGVNGLLLDDAADIAQLAHHMNRLQDNPDWAAKLGRAARRTAEGLSWDAIAQQTMRVYEEVVTSRNSVAESCHTISK
jgi:UDP-glucose:(heptosyl)LPS alpha-1,3-glucosyltransferase